MPGSNPGAARRAPARFSHTPAWLLVLGTFVTTLTIFGASFGYASGHLYATNAPLQPSAVTATANRAASTTSSGTMPSTTALTSAVRTTSRSAVTTTHHS